MEKMEKDVGDEEFFLWKSILCMCKTPLAVQKRTIPK